MLQIFQNKILIATLTGWFLAQVIKIPIDASNNQSVAIFG